MQTLLDLLSEIRALDTREAIRFFDGYRTQTLSYRQLYARVGGCARLLDAAGFKKGDRLLLWAENRPEWVIAFWACLARGGVVVPIDFRSSPAFVERVQRDVNATLLVSGSDDVPAGVRARHLSLDRIAAVAEPDRFEVSEARRDDIVEIVYTSGTTGDPKGVVHRHRHICANLAAIQAGIQPYRSVLRPFQPLRILDLLPLSHMFGQSLGVTVPVLLGGAVVFVRDLHPDTVIETIRRERVSVLVGVPRALQALQRHVGARFDLSAAGATEDAGLLRRCWRSRRLHGAFGWKFWFFVVGGARVDPEMEAFWSRLGFGVVQGYGLTEASPVVTLNHPFRTRRGSLGKAIRGQDVRIAPDGEILVRGESIVSEVVSGAAIERITKDGWLHTGDIGETDAEGRLYYRGRKKEVIVTSEGLNVHPQDVEAVLGRLPGILESAVVGIDDRVHAALVLADGKADPEALIQRANAALEPHQRIRSWTIWPEARLPRTPSTMKVLNHEVARRISETSRSAPRTRTETFEDLLSRLTGRRAPDDRHRLVEDLGLSSLDRVDLLSGLETIYDLRLDEEAFARLATVGELRSWLQTVSAGGLRTLAEGAGDGPPCEPEASGRERPRPRVETPPWSAPEWPRFPLLRAIGIANLEGLVLPFLRLPVRLSVDGLDHLRAAAPPLLFAANHTSHLDTPVLLSALPSAWRRRVAPAIAQDAFNPYFQTRSFPLWRRVGAAVRYWTACGLFNAFPLPKEAVSVRRVLKFMGGLMDRGYCPLVFPEGARAADGRLRPFRSGIGLMALRLRAPVIPVCISGLEKILPPGRGWPVAGKARVKIGPPLDLSSESDYAAATRRVEAAVRSLREAP